MFGNGQDDNSQQMGQPDLPIPADLTDNSMGMPTASGSPMPSAPAAMATPAADDTGMASDDAFQSSPTPAMDTPSQMNPSSRLSDASAPDDLINIKQEALQSLKPLVGHLD